ncbi:MAG TPA: multicopper oxidase domain-containing protein [Terriglobales bacterium]|jgi:FtsP/CotA-like multicopper oxidase with cupredoxin domain|nr:multicopper oxidase domain-containing protein [Terriglobales bacterium]
MQAKGIGMTKKKNLGKDRKKRNVQAVTRREFVNQMLAATSGLALMPLLSSFADPMAMQGSCPADTFPKIREIISKGGKLKAVLTIKNTQKRLPGYTGSQLPVMRYFEGRDQTDGTVWPPTDQVQACLPGPTLRAKVGEKVEITFLNHVTPGAFSNSGLSIDNAEQGKGTGCDMYTNAALKDPNTGAPAPDNKWYPETRGDVFPNCFHASSTANLHFHGTHVSPDDFADNVLVQVRPDTTFTEQVAAPLFKQVFAYAESAHHIEWDKAPEAWRTDQANRIKNYDETAIWQGKRGTPGNPALPFNNRLATKNAQLRAEGKWPEFFVGGYPNCFQITEAAGHEMGQAPGTHWYHAHKHGSTAIHLYNGLAGAFIIEGDYDRDLRAIYPDLDQTQKVLLVQRFTDMNDLERAANNNTIPVMVNGGLAGADLKNPAVTIQMRPGEIQLWRIVNAMVENSIRASFKDSSGAVVPMFRQIAQDGVQFKLANYQKQPLTLQDHTTKNATRLWVAAGGRADILVKAPASGTFSFIDPGQFPFANYVNVIVCGDPVDMDFPNEGRNAGKYPVFPDFLHDIGPCRKSRNLDFGWEPYRLVSAPAASGSTHADPKDITKKAALPITVKVDGNNEFVINVNRAPYFTLDGVQFSEKNYGQTLVLDEPEEWLIINTTSIRHPYHIHVNPFQLVEVYDPNDASNNYKAEEGGIWHDVILIPPAKTDSSGNLVIGNDGKATQPGHVRIRSRYVDFTGDFVLHCHLLGHEDRGMMQLVRIIPAVSYLQHH